MRQSEARDLRSFLAEPVEEFVEEGAEAHNTDVGVPFTNPCETQLHEVGVQFLNGKEMQLQGIGVRFAAPWEGTGGQLHEVGARFTQPLTSSTQNDGVGAPLASPWGATPWGATTGTPVAKTPPMASDMPAPDQDDRDDLTLQQTMPIARIPELSGVQSGLSPLRPYRLQRYQSRGVPVSLTRSASGTLRLRPAGSNERRTTADLAPAPQKIIPSASPSAPQSWERRRRTIYTWLVLFTLFLLVVLGGIGLDSLIASYR